MRMLFRLCYLYIHGGIYVDVDISCHGPLEKIPGNNDFRCFFLYAEGRPWCIENGFIVAEPGNGIIALRIWPGCRGGHGRRTRDSCPAQPGMRLACVRGLAVFRSEPVERGFWR